MITEDERKMVKLLIDYDNRKEKIDRVSGCSNFDFPISGIKMSEYVLTVTLPSGKYFFLPIINHKILVEERKRKMKQKMARGALILEQIRQEERTRLAKIKEQIDIVAKEVSNRKTSEENAEYDGAAWWVFMKEYYYDNYRAAQDYYDKDKRQLSLVLGEFFKAMPKGTVNDYFRVLGLHAIKAVNGTISVDGKRVATYDKGMIHMDDGDTFQYRW